MPIRRRGCGRNTGTSSSTNTACRSMSLVPSTKRRRIATHAPGRPSATRKCGRPCRPDTMTERTHDASGVDAVARFGSGRAVARVEDRALLRGLGRFSDNVPVAGETTIAFLRSPYAHVRIVAIDAGAARAMPGVLAVYTGAEIAAAGIQPLPTSTDFRRADGRTTVSPPRRALAHEFARYVGEPVAAVVAESRNVARDALDAIAIEFEELPSVVGVEAAMGAGAPAGA